MQWILLPAGNNWAHLTIAISLKWMLKFIAVFSDVLQDHKVSNEALARTPLWHMMSLAVHGLCPGCWVAWKAFSESGESLNEHPKRMIVDK